MFAEPNSILQPVGNGENVKSLSFFQEEPHIPIEFTHAGMLERINSFVENQVTISSAVSFS